jgi:hypothetical protein
MQSVLSLKITKKLTQNIYAGLAKTVLLVLCFARDFQEGCSLFQILKRKFQVTKVVVVYHPHPPPTRSS